MTCAHVLGLIDAGPFAGYPPAHLEAAWSHARQCATCGPALRVATALSDDLAVMPNPEPPAHLASAVLARIARLPTSAETRATVRPAAPERPRWHDYAAAAEGIVAACLIAVSFVSGEAPPVDLTSARIGGTAGLLGMERTATWWITLAVSLVLYLTGLFTPVSGARRRGSHRGS